MKWEENQLYLIPGVFREELLKADKWGNNEADHALHNLIDCLALQHLSLQDVELVEDIGCGFEPMVKVIRNGVIPI